MSLIVESKEFKVSAEIYIPFSIPSGKKVFLLFIIIDKIFLMWSENLCMANSLTV